MINDHRLSRTLTEQDLLRTADALGVYPGAELQMRVGRHVFCVRRLKTRDERFAYCTGLAHEMRAPAGRRHVGRPTWNCRPESARELSGDDLAAELGDNMNACGGISEAWILNPIARFWCEPSAQEITGLLIGPNRKPIRGQQETFTNEYAAPSLRAA